MSEQRDLSETARGDHPQPVFRASRFGMLPGVPSIVAPGRADLMALVAYPAVIGLFFWNSLASGAGDLASGFGATFLAAAFTYLFARISLAASPPAAWLAGSIFALGGFVGARMAHPNQLYGPVWLPALLLCLERAAVGRDVRALGLGSVAMALQLLSGDAQGLYPSGWALALFALYLVANSPSRGWARLRPLGALAGMAAGGAVLAGFRLLPLLERARESHSAGGVPFGVAVASAVIPREILDSLLPLYWELPRLDVAGYTGVVALTLLPPSLAWERRTFQHFFAVLGLLGLLLSLGDSTPLYGWLYRTAPGFDLLLAPGRWLSLYGLSVALVAGVGADALRTACSGRDPARWVGIYALALGAGVALLVVLRLWLGSQGQDLALPHGRIVMTWGIFLVAGTAASLVVRAWPRKAATLGALVALTLLELYLAKEPMPYNRRAEVPAYPAVVDCRLVEIAGGTSDLGVDSHTARFISRHGGSSSMPQDSPRVSIALTFDVSMENGAILPGGGPTKD